MGETQITMTELRQKLGQLVSEVAYGQERLVLMSHGTPKAALVSIADLRRLQQVEHTTPATTEGKDPLTELATLRARIDRWQQENEIVPEDSTLALNHVRESRDDELGRLS